MKPEIIKRRVAAFETRVDYYKLTHGLLSEQEERDFQGDLAAWEEAASGFNVTYLSGTGAAALAEIHALVDQYEPEVLLVDGTYFIGERDNKVTALVTSALKESAVKRWNIPVVNNTQMNAASTKDTGAMYNMEGGYYGDSYAQDSDVLLKLRATPEDKFAREVFISPAKVREGVGRAFYARMKLATDFSFLRFEEGQEHLNYGGDDEHESEENDYAYDEDDDDE